MRLLPGLLISTLALGTFAITGCAEHRYRTDPYYGYGGGYSGYYADNDPYYRQWLAERRYDYVDYNRLSRERQQEYWQWRRQNEARFRQDRRFRDNQRYAQNGNYSNGRYANDHDRDDRRTNNYARTRDGDKDRHQRDRDRHQVRKDKNKDKDRDHDRDHDRR